jgi:CheY-like chemotaxis protein
MTQPRPPKIVVLVVEDEPLQRMMAVLTVEEAGFEAIDVGSADEAVKVLESRDDIRIVFTDVQMPGSMDGLKLAAAIRDRWPPIEIIVTSGIVDVPNLLLPARSRFFAKPYDSDKVSAAMKALTA